MGKLYVVSTPIGNLEDITLRALKILKNVDLILCEDTRISQKLLTHYGIKTKLISFYQEKERKKFEKFAELVKKIDIALISDNGTPTISDPGYKLINKCIELGFDVVPVPGPSAIIAAISISGFSADKFYFYGFLPKKKGKKRKILNKLSTIEGIIGIYETQYKLNETINFIFETFDKTKRIFICRELTKLYEEKIRCTIKEAKDKLDNNELKIKGEFVILIENYLKKNF